MQALHLNQERKLLDLVDAPFPAPNDQQILIKVSTCGVCRTDLHLLDAELPNAKKSVIPGHQIVGYVEKLGNQVTGFKIGDRVGVPWLGGSCGQCEFCKQGQENLCNEALYTGYQIDGGFAEYCVANAQYCFPIPEEFSDLSAAPLLCAGLIGWRALKKTGKAKRIGLYGFGAAAHLVIQVAKFQEREVFVFTKPGDTAAQEFANDLGATWSGPSEETPPQKLDAAILFAPVGELIPQALSCTKKGGIVVCAGIHMSEIPAFNYDLLWGERTLTSVANLTRQDGIDFFRFAKKIKIKTRVHEYPLEKTGQALEDLRKGKFTGSAVINLNSKN